MVAGGMLGGEVGSFGLRRLGCFLLLVVFQSCCLDNIFVVKCFVEDFLEQKHIADYNSQTPSFGTFVWGSLVPRQPGKSSKSSYPNSFAAASVAAAAAAASVLEITSKASLKCVLLLKDECMNTF